MDINNLKVPTIAESANQALREIANAKAIRYLGRNHQLQELQTQFDNLEPGTDPATPKSLSQLAQQIRDAYAELEGIGQEYLGSPEHKLALNCLKALIAEYNFQSDDLAARIL
jgi:hypothetical protein